MSNPYFELDEEDYNDGYVLVFNSITNDKALTDAAYRLLVHLHSNSDVWKVRGRFTAKLLGWGKDKLTRAIRELYNHGFITRLQMREKGKWDYFVYKVSFKKKFQNPKWEEPKKRSSPKLTETGNVDENLPKALPLSARDLQPQPVKSAPVNPAPEKQPLPMPNKPMPNSKALIKALPVSSNRSSALVSKATPKSKSRIHKRTPEKEELFEYLKSLEFGPKNERLDEDTASVLANQYSYKQVEDCYFDLMGKISRGQNIRNPIGVFRTLLKDENCPRGKDSTSNRAFAIKCKLDFQWGSLVIGDKFVSDKNFSGKDLCLNMPPESFRNSLISLQSSLY